MGQTRMFRDRVVSMEQTFEGGEKHLAILKEICGEALPGFVFREHSLDHERDLFVMDFEGPDGARRRVSWTRMVLFDAERIPTLAADPAAALRSKIVELAPREGRGARDPRHVPPPRGGLGGHAGAAPGRPEAPARRREAGEGSAAGARPAAPPRDRERRPGGRARGRSAPGAAAPSRTGARRAAAAAERPSARHRLPAPKARRRPAERASAAAAAAAAAAVPGGAGPGTGARRPLRVRRP